MQGTNLPTSAIIREVSEERELQFVKDLTRTIPNKQMPPKNSPTNRAGGTVRTMMHKHIVIVRYLPPR